MKKSASEFLKTLPPAVQNALFAHGEILEFETVQPLWKGYGEILRAIFKSSPSLILKYIRPPATKESTSHLRKIKSYEVEAYWYSHFNNSNRNCYFPSLIGKYQNEKELFLVMEDLDQGGLSRRLLKANLSQIRPCISWLANFHAQYLNTSASGLWAKGTYWHLETRPDELEALGEGALKMTASLIDKKLDGAKFKTIVHGDAKLANFCFSNDLKNTAMVDFQYVGRGCAMKDLAYFMSSVFNSEECYRREKSVLDYYFDALEKALEEDITEIETEWRSLYKYAWADFYRFLEGWSPDHHKIHKYSMEQSESAQREVLQELEQTALAAATKAGSLIQAFSKKQIVVAEKEGHSPASQVVTEADIESQKIILEVLKESVSFYDFGILAEEAPDEGERKVKDYFWCIDPLDGTLHFSQTGKGHAVSVALVSKSGSPIVAAVFDPSSNDAYSASLGQGARKNHEPFAAPAKGENWKIFADLSLIKQKEFSDLSKKFEVIFGSGAVMNAISCIESPPAIYIKPPKKEKGGGSIWDFAATSLIINEAAGLATDFFGRPLKLNRPDTTYMNQDGVYFSSDKKRTKLF